MADLVTVLQSDSTNDGSGASTTIEPPQVDNAVDDAIIIKVTQSLNNSTNVANIVVTTPTGYTLLTDIRYGELRSWVFYKQSTGSESIPTVTSDTVAKWSATTVIVTDVDWANGGVAQYVENTGGGDQQSPDLTTSANGAASAIVCLYSVERRTVTGFTYPQTRPQTVFEGQVNTGTSEGVDNASAAAWDFITDRSTLWDGPFWNARAAGDSLAVNIEVVTLGNIVPLQVSNYVLQPAPANTFQTNMDWCREICDSGKHIDGSTLQIWSFDDTNVDTANNYITLTAHGMDESMVVRLSATTPPGGLADDTFYYVEPVSADVIQLRSVNEDTDATSDYYADGTTKRPIVGISSIGSGSMTFTEARMINAGQGVLVIYRSNIGDASNVGTFSGNYAGDSGFHQNDVGTCQRFNSITDLTNQTLTFVLQVHASSRLSRVSMTLIDEDGDWMTWQIWKQSVSPNITGQQTYQFQVDKASVQSVSAQSFGTFDAARVRYLVVSLRGNNRDSSRWGAVSSITSLVEYGGPLTVVNGQNANFNDLVTLASKYVTTITKTSDLQIVSLVPIQFGDGTNDISFTDSEKSLAFPPLADGVTSFQNYLESLGVTIDATSSSTVKIVNSQIGASVPYSFDVTAAAGAIVDLTGNSYVFGTATLDSDVTYSRQLFVGGEGITDNNSQIRSSTFITNSQLGADNGMINWGASTDIESSAFELSTGTTTGHGIKITTPGTYTFTALTFNGFGADGSNTAAVYNDSGGVVEIVTDGGDQPTVRNGSGASTTRSVPPNTVSITGITAGSRLQIYNVTTATEVANEIVAGTSYSADYQEGVGYSTGDTIRIRLTYTSGVTAKLPFESAAVAGASGWALLVSQSDDSVYNTYALDGSAITKFTADYVNDEVDIIVASNFEAKELYAWLSYNLTTEQGIREFYNGLVAVDQANLKINNSTVNIFLDNTTTTNIWQTDNIRIFRADESYPVKNPATTGGGGIDIVWRNTILIAETPTSGLTAAESAQLAAIPTNPLLTDDARIDTFDTKTNIKPSVSI
jgi:hypothetical protein